jgi:riboflavin kinase/FMN adenylyltransferase
VSSPKIWHSLDDVPADLRASAVTIGNFDGVHRGHRYVLDTMAREAETRGLEPVALTFWPHPRHVMDTPGVPPLITCHDDRDRLLLLAGMHGVLDLPFTRDFAQYSPEDFVRVFLVEGLRMQCIVMGEDTRFGKANAGDIHTMRALGEQYGFDVVTLPDLGPTGPGSGRISSSAIRAALLEGDMPAATDMLGRFHTVTDLVHHGHRRGREMGFPTANLGQRPDGLVPADGVYAGFLTVVRQAAGHEGTPPLLGAPASISIGTNPTFHEGADVSPRMVEAYVHADGQDLDLYGDTVRLEFVARQRPTLRFDEVAELVDQMEQDKVVTRRTLDGVRPDPDRLRW